LYLIMKNLKKECWIMTDKVDLHIHSTLSDGLLSVKEIFKYASERKLKSISITDHDCADAVAEGVICAADTGVEFIPGIEISSNIGNYDVHILGYFIDVSNVEFNQYLDNFKAARMKRAVKMINLLARQGVRISIDEVKKKSCGENIGRPHLAEVIVEKGYCRNFREVFDKYLGNRSKCYVKKFELSPRDAIKIIHNAGGLAFIAHPGYLKNDLDVLYDILNSGVDGLETIHSSHGPADVELFRKIVKENKLLEVGGSDCHGGRKNGNIIIGNYDVPYDFVQQMKDKVCGNTDGKC